MKHLQSFIALCIIVAMAFAACDNPAGSGPEQINTIDPVALYVDESGNITEADSGRIVLVADDQAAVVLYSDDVESDANRVALTFDNKTIAFFFEKNWYFPTGMALTDSEETLYGLFTPYDHDTQTYGITFEQGDDKETYTDIALSPDIFARYIDDPELTPSQNLRLQNMYIAMQVYTNLRDCIISSDNTPQTRAVFQAQQHFDLMDKCLIDLPPEYYGTILIFAGAFDILYGTANLVSAFLAAPSIVSLVTVGTSAATITSGIGGLIDGINTLRGNPPWVDVTGVDLHKEFTNLDIGEINGIVPIIKPSRATNKNVKWESSDPYVVEVRGMENGVGAVLGRRAGTATITVTTNVGNKTASCVVTVNPMPVTGISLNKTSATIMLGDDDYEILSATIAPANATNKNVTWESSDERVAKVYSYFLSQGFILCFRVGTTTITATTDDGGYKATCVVTVIPPAVTGVSLDKTSLSLIVGATETLTTTITPANAPNKGVTWSSSNAAVATVTNSGTVAGISAGTATITVTTADGNKTASCAVTVNPIAVTGVTLNKTSASLVVGYSETLVPLITPANATNKTVSWSSSNSSVATVSQDGTVSGKSTGTATITVATADGGKTASCTVTVNNSSDAVGQTLAAQLLWLESNAVSNGAYTLEVNADETIEWGSYSFSYTGKDNITVILKGIGANRTISGSFSVFSDVTLILDSNITLQGVTVGGTLIMEDGISVLSVSVGNGGTFTMNGGTISGHTAEYGGGVSVRDDGTFTMSGGTITGNTAEYGGGVSVRDSGTFTMSGGTITGNTANRGGGGVYVDSGGTFTMSGGIISGNTTAGRGGGGVSAGIFTMSGGTISGNKCSNLSESYGAGVWAGTFTMSGGTITGNTGESGGGVAAGDFTMSGGAISGNTARYGGGVWVLNTDSSFTMSGGTISGNTAREGGGVQVASGTFSIVSPATTGNIHSNTATIEGPNVCKNYIGKNYGGTFTVDGIETEGY